jgi:hypothetical protein
MLKPWLFYFSHGSINEESFRILKNILLLKIKSSNLINYSIYLCWTYPWIMVYNKTYLKNLDDDVENDWSENMWCVRECPMVEVFPKTKGWGSKRQPSLGLAFWTCLANKVTAQRKYIWLHRPTRE